MMIHRHKRLIRFVAAFLAMNMMYSIVFPTAALALTGGPSQPEVQSFEPVGTTDMVDVFSGDFNYNIPLIDVEGYPINIAYHSGITMDQEASWVGLGWNVNPGVINRNMRGLPDDFNGDLVTKNFYIKPNWTLGTNFGLGIEFCGFGKASYGLGVYYNNYKGLGFENVVNLGISTTGPAKLGANVALSSNTQSGFTISPSLSFSVNGSKKDKAAIEHKGGVGVSIGASYNSRSGMKTMNYGISVSSSSKSADGTKTVGGKTEKQAGAAGGASAGNNFSKISPGAQTYVPQLSMPMTSFNGTVRVTVGSEAYTLHPNGWVSGYFSNQSLATTGVTKAAYGYIYSHNKTSSDVLLDFNREKDGSYTTQNPVLPITNFTYDIYSVSGQGVGGMFRPYRNDIGVVHDDVMYSTSGSMSLGVEVGVGAGAHFGVDENAVSFNSSSAVWANNLYNLINFKASTGDPAYEPWYFKTVGEKTPVDENFLPNQNISAAFSAALYSSGGLYHTDVAYLNSTAPETGYRKNIVSSALVKSSRVSRNQMITSYTAAQYRECDTRYIESYSLNDFRNNPVKINRKKGQSDPGVSPLDAYRLDDHVSELVVTQNNGSRYVYGIAAYNTKQTESSFANRFTSDKETGQVDFDSNYLSSKKGETGQAYDGYFSSTSLPAYAHSYLLTAVLSADYVDVSQNGPTPDDLGTYTKINYTRLHNNYKWRVPYKHTSANASDGTNSDSYDDKANIIEGEKEIWFVNSVETKNYKAIFVLGNRRDGVSAKHTSGNTTLELKCLKSIQLFTKAELRVTGREPIPVKTVNFEYDYSLCPNVENNPGGAIDQDGNTSGTNINTAKGKLTLKKIYFTYGTSQKSRFSAYTFTYNSGPVGNPSYNLKGYDRWGSYKPHQNIGEATPLYNSDHPYVLQEDASNDYAQAWCLKEIRMPSGGKIKVDYESDDYAYVQNRRAQQMFRIAGFSNTLGGTIKNELYSGDDDAVNNYVFIQLTGTKYATVDAAYFQNEFVRGIENLYFNMLIKLAYGETYESVRGYTSIEESGVIDKGGIRYGWIRVEKANIDTGDDDKVSPFSKAAWQFARINMPHLVYPGSDFKRTGDVGGAIVSGVKSLVGVFFDLVDMARGFNEILRSKGFARHVKSNRSWIRLNSPDKMKKGGGVRVKSIRMTDNWNSITNGAESDFEYGQEYDYTMQEKFGTGYRTISSGVASYEPMVGNDENPFRQPVSYDKQNYLIPDDSYYTEEPFGEIFFPSASVGYSRVTVRNLKHTNVNKHATGKTVHEFYTAYDFPTITRRTNVDSRPVTPGVLKGLFSFNRSSNMTTSQGFMIELNDMHGKPKAQWTYAEPAVGETNDELKLLSGVQYLYKTDANDASHLNNVVPALKKDGSLVNQLVGVESDLVGDMRQSLSETGSGGVQINTEFFLAFIFPVAIPTFLPSYATERTAYRSVVMTKVVNRFGILEKTVAYQDGASISTKNLAWDAETGEVLLTSVENEYKDNIYNVTYPAYWAYDLMGPAYKNEGITLNGLSVNGSGVISLTGGLVPSNYFVPGDEVFIISNQNASINGRYWVDNTTTPGQLILKAYNGNLPLTGHTYKAHIARSGRRNMMSMPMAAVTSLQTPLVGSVLTLDNNTKVVNTNSMLYSDKWNKQCGYNVVTTTVCDTLNSYNDMLNTLLYFINSKQLTTSDAAGTLKGFDTTSSGNNLFRNSRLNRLMDSCGTGDQFYVTNDSSWVYTGDVIHFDTVVNNYKVMVCKDTMISVDDLFTDSVISVTITDQGLIRIVFVNYGGPVMPSNPSVIEYWQQYNLRELIPCVPANFDQYMDKAGDYKYNIYNPETRTFNVQCCDSVDRSDTTLVERTESAGYYNHNLGFTISTCAGCANATINYNDTGCTLGKTIQSMSVVSQDGPYATVSLNFGGGCTVQATIYFYCPPIVNCRLASAICTLFSNTSNNRFLDGTKGIWRKKKEYLFLEKRRRNNVAQGDIRRDGYYESFSPFWSRVASTGYVQNPSLSSKWQWTNEITNYDARNGQELEVIDALGRYSSVLFSQTANITLATAVANNANRRQIGFNGFEEMEMINLPNYGSETACPSEHWNFYKETPSVTYDVTVSHTGLNSAKVPSGLSIWNEYDVRQYTVSDSQYCADCILPFYPDTGKYFISGWVKTSAQYTDAADRNATLQVNVSGSSPQSYTFKPSGKIIEGWQRIEGVIMIPAGSTKIKVTWKGSTVSGQFAWFDDLRILPFNGSLKSYVYDPQTNRLMAELDENNYATFYEYDEQGALKRVKKETENGIATISESRNSNIKRR